MRILMPIDGSSSSDAAVDFVTARIERMQDVADVELVNIQHPVSMRVARALGKEIVQAHHQAEAAGILEPAAAKLSGTGAQATRFTKVGTVHHEIAGIVEGHEADLVVMASHGETGVARLLAGSVASTIAASSTKPLLILRAPVPARDSLKVAIAVDAAGQAAGAARFVARHRHFFGRAPEITLVHVVPELSRVVVPGWVQREVETGIPPAEARVMQEAAFRTVFEPVHALLRAAGLEAGEARLVGHDPGSAIGAYARDARPDVLAFGSTGYGAHRFSNLGSVAARAAALATASLLLVRDA